MNAIYTSIWNESTGTCVAASENAKTTGKKASCSKRTGGATVHFELKALALSLMLSFGGAVFAAPAGGVVTAGSASINNGAGNTLITQTTQNAAINWLSFNIAAGESVKFVQPNANSVALNRVLGSDPSNILGSLSANGKVFLVNPNGILFGQGASVNVGGLVASTLNVTDSDFMAGSYKFAGAGKGAVVNQGSINASGGYVALLGANVANNGVITAKLGSVALAAGNAMTLDVAGDGLLNVTVNQGVVNALVQNGGLIQADGGQVMLTAMAAGSLMSSAVNNTGVIQAQTIENRNGTIKLMGDMQSGTVIVGGTLDVSGTGAGQTGGNVTVTGHHVGLFSGHIDASGDAGGGAVLIGGGYQGKNAAVENASATYMSADSTISADAITNGNGGTAVLWSTDSTRAYGSISARGGALGGNGGLIETSGHWLDVAGININASAPSGSRGMWLLDPADVTITAATLDATLSAGVFSPNSGVNAATVNVATLQTTLGVGGAGTDVTITTTNTGAAGVPLIGLGNITVASVISWSPTTPTTLTLNAAGDVIINAAVTAVGGNFVACCGRDVNVNAPITTTNGSVLLSAGRDVNIIRTTALTGITTTDGNIAICAGNNINLNNLLNPGLAPLITLTTGSVTAGQDLATLGVRRGLTLSAGNAGTGPGAAGGTVIFTNGGPSGTFITTTGPDPVTPTNIYYNPTAYTLAGSTDYSTFFTGTGGPLTQYMLVFPGGADKTYDGTRTANLTGLKGSPAGVTLAGAGTATFDTADAGTNKTIIFSGFTLTQGAPQTGGTGTNFAFPVTCCAPIESKTTATISPAPVVVLPDLTVFATNQTKPYGQTMTLTEFTSTGLLGGQTIGAVTLTSAGTPATANIGPYAITASNARGGTFIPGNYTISYVNGVLTVVPAALTITASNVAKSYGQTPTLSGFTVAGLMNGDTVTSVTESSPGTVATAPVAGSPYAITPSAATGGTFTPANYIIGYVNGALTVTPVALTVTASNVSKAYGQAPTLSGFTAAGLVNGDTVGSVTETSPGAVATATAAGSPYVITPSAATGGTFVPSNYVIGYVNGVLTVVSANLIVTASDVTKSYGQTPTLSAFTTTGLINGETVGSVTETSPGRVATAPVAGSPFAITPSAATGGTFIPANYTISYVNGALTVTPIPLTVTASNVAKSYGQAPALTGFTTTALVNGETVTSVTETSPGQVATAAVVGSPYAITPSGATGGFTPSNYTINYVNGVLTVSPAPLTVTANSNTKVYGTTFTPAGTAFTTTGLQNSETVGSVTELSPAGTPATAAVPGPYAITPSAATGGTFAPGNYTISYVNGALTLTPAPLTVTANDVTKTFGQTPALTGFTTTPLVNGESIGSVTETSPGSVATAPATGSPYAITPSGAIGGTFTPSNYTIAYNNGVLTVTPAIVPPIVTPPVVVPPIVTPPVVVPPVEPPPVVIPPVVVPPVENPPVDVPPIENPPVVVPPVTPVTWVPVVTPPATPPELLTLVPPTPVVRPAPPAPVPVPVFVPTPIVTPVAPPPAVYLAPVHLRKQDRN